MTHGRSGISKNRKVQFLFTVSMSDLGPRKCIFYPQNASFESGRGTGATEWYVLEGIRHKLREQEGTQ
jgi:hypothetical protein